MSGDWMKAGALLRQARGETTVTNAAHLAGVSRSWWQNVEKGAPEHEPKPEKLAAAARAVSADLVAIFELVGFDPRPFAKVVEGKASIVLGGLVSSPPAREERELRDVVVRLALAHQALAEVVKKVAAASGVDASSLRDVDLGLDRAAQ